MSKLSLAPLAAQWEATPETGVKYQRLAEAFAACIRSGTYMPGGHLPKETEISASLPSWSRKRFVSRSSGKPDSLKARLGMVNPMDGTRTARP